MTVNESWTCPTCSSTVSTPFCPGCGESFPRARDLTLRGLCESLFRAFINVDSRLVRSFRYLLVCPGLLTVAYVQGRRRPFIEPFQLFLIVNVLFFAVQSRTNTNIVSSQLDSHLHNQDWSALAQRLVSSRLETLNTTLDVFAPVFNRAVVLHAKSFIILMALPFALLLPLVFYRSRQPFVAHVVFSLHLYTFLLLLFCVSLAIAALDVTLGGIGLNSSRLDRILSTINLAACATYLYQAAGTVYSASGAIRAIKALVLALVVAGILLGYRFVLFVVTLYTT